MKFKPQFKIYIIRFGHIRPLPETYPSYKKAYAVVKQKKIKKFKIVLDNWDKACYN